MNENKKDKKEISDLIIKIKEITEINDKDYTITPYEESQQATIEDKKTGVIISVKIDENNKVIIGSNDDITPPITRPTEIKDLEINIENEDIYYIGKKLEFNCYGGIKSAKLNGKLIETGTVINEVGTYHLILTDNYSNEKQIKFYVNDGLLALVKDSELEEGVQTVTVNGVEYNINVIEYYGDLLLDGITENAVSTLSAETKTYEVGEIADVATSTTYAQNTVVLKVDGNLTINPDVTLTAVKNAEGYGGPKGMYVCVNGTIINNGTISMTARGAKAEGQDVYLWQNTNGEYETIPAAGGIGGVNTDLQYSDTYGATYSVYYKLIAGRQGESITSGRALAGGGAGGFYIEGKIANIVQGYIGNGVQATSYSGGAGGGGLAQVRHSITSTTIYRGNSGAQNGGTGGNGSTYDGTPTWYRYAGGGASGAGSINVFYINEMVQGTITANGGIGGIAYTALLNGGNGGDGSKSVGKIVDGTYVEN